MTINLSNHYNRFNPADGDEAILFRAGRGLQSPELNEMQSIREHQLKRIADQFMVDGSIQSGGAIVIDQDTGATTCATAEIYLRGRIRDVAERQMIIPILGDVQIGVWLTESVVTELEDPTLRDPAEGARNYDEPGAARLRIHAEWGLSNDDHTGNFYRVYDVENAVLKIKSAPPDMTGFNNALARYDRDNNGGHYIIHGLDVIYNSHDDINETYSIREGKAHVFGYEIELPTSLRLRFPFDPDLQTILSEPHQFNNPDGAKQRVNIDRTPVHDIRKVDITKQVTQTIIHGSYSGVADALPDDAVIEIVKVKQSATTYNKTTDYIFSGGLIDWSPAGNEPAPGSSYEVTYKYITQVVPTDVDERGFSVEGAVEGSLILVDYQWRLPRTDTITIDREGKITRIKGMPRRFNPKPTPAPTGQLELAQLLHNWFDDKPTNVNNTAIAAVAMGTLQDMRSDIFDLYDLVAIERLRSEAIATAPTATRGVFVDPFQNDSMRDLGQAQTAAIVDGELMLPIHADVHSLDAGDLASRPITLPYRDVLIIEQLARTGIMKINPYAAFDPIPASVTLMPPVDIWTDTETVNGADVTRDFGGGGLLSRTTETIERRTIGVKAAEYLRPITIKFNIEGFRPDEPLRNVIFDGIEINVEAQS
ncbi:DUF4815 domain-containing protein [Psychrobacter celer]|uniref:DUF4815 domain-containing protein n=1 Tax=Psychrobacter celer TaxID=306572 RepID=UPI003FD0C149